MTQNSDTPISPILKVYAGFSPDTEDDEFRDYLEREFPTEIEKPCGLLLWCPYGPLVEDFPLHGRMHNGGDCPRESLVEPASCAVFGHDCPAFYVAEPFADPDAVADNCLCDECRAARDAGEDAPIDKPSDDSDGDA